MATTKTKSATRKAKTKTAKPATNGDKITLLVEENPHAAGTPRAGWFKKLKTGQTVDEAAEAGVPRTYLRRIAARGIVKLS